MKKILVAGGCFWGVEAYFKRIKGIVKTDVGYAQGTKENPSYNEVCSGDYEFVEVCMLHFDPNLVNLEALIDRLFKVIDPTAINKQGPDVGVQYRTGIYYFDASDEDAIEKIVQAKEKNYSKPLQVEVEAVKNFYLAENYHQDYLTKNPNGYCHINLDLLYEQ